MRQTLHEVICWLTGYDERSLQQQIEGKVDFETFFAGAADESERFEEHGNDLRV